MCTPIIDGHAVYFLLLPGPGGIVHKLLSGISPFRLKKPSISPLKYFAVACQTCGSQETQAIFSEKMLLAFWYIAHTRINIF